MLKLYYAAYMTYQVLTVQPETCLMDKNALIEQLKRHEGVKHFPYVDTAGKMTIGAGRNLTDRGITIGTINQLLAEDIIIVTTELDNHYPEWCDLSENRQLVLANMTFNLGMPRYLTFERFWAALRQGQWELASQEMLRSRWARQVGDRALELSELMKNG